MAIIFEPYIVPEKGTVELNLKRSFEIKLSASEARRQVNRWLRDEVSMLMGAESPTLIVTERTERVVWRVPVVYSAPDAGRVGIVDAIDVDVVTGSMDATAKRKSKIERQAEALAERLPPYHPLRESPADYVAKTIPPSPKLILDENGYPIVIASP